MGNLLQMLEGSKTAQRYTKITELGSKLSTLREEVRIASPGSWGGPHKGGTQVSGWGTAKPLFVFLSFEERPLGFGALTPKGAIT